MESQQAVWELDLSQSQMPASKRQRRGSRNARALTRTSRVPRAISTRGTPSGYYEMQSNTLMRFYCNTSTGAFGTNQNTGGATTATGYQGMSFWSTLAQLKGGLGNGALTDVQTTAFGQFDQLKNVFDLCKIVDMEFEFWITNQSPTLSTTAYGAPEFWFAVDPNDAVPPSSAVEIQDYSSVRRVIMDQRSHKFKFKPHIDMMVGTGVDETQVQSVQGATMPSTYIRTANDTTPHFGLKGWLYIPSANASSYTFELNVKVTQTRRYKSCK